MSDPLHPSQYTVGLLCALSIEQSAIIGILDAYHGESTFDNDPNLYILGQIGSHNVTIACCPAGEPGQVSAASLAKDMTHTFRFLRFGLLVGIGGGAPSEDHDIRLGDVVVGIPSGTAGGVIQYDRGKSTEYGFERTGHINSPEKILLSTVNLIRSKVHRGAFDITTHLNKIIDENPTTKEIFSHPGRANDRLYPPNQPHVYQSSRSKDCEGCGDNYESGETRKSEKPKFHYGNIGSGNLVVKNAFEREKIRKQDDLLCFETEAVGLSEVFRCLVIRGISDYSDSHKNDKWQGYAAATAAAFAKGLLLQIKSAEANSLAPIPPLNVSDPVLHKITSSINSNITEQTREQNHRYQDEKTIKCLQVFKTSTYEDFKNANCDRIPGTCKWVLADKRYIDWRSSQKHDLLWITADPGCGKSVLSKSLIEKELHNTEKHTVCYFFFKDNEAQNNLATALCALLHQLFGRMRRLITHAIPSYENNGDSLQRETSELWRILLEAATDAGDDCSVTCVLDALDECCDEDRPKLIQFLNGFHSHYLQLSTNGKSQLKFLLTSRPYKDIEQEFQVGPNIRLSGEDRNVEIGEEIDIVINQRVREAASKYRMQDKEHEILREKLLATKNRTYLWVHLVFEELPTVGKFTETTFRELVDSLPSTVEDAYEKILEKINSLRPNDQRMAKILLHIIVGAHRPLTLDELDVAFQLATESASAQTYEELNLDRERLPSRIRDLCGLFVFERNQHIYLIHQTAKEFLVSRTTSDVPKAKGDESMPVRWKHCLSQRESDELLARICIRYLCLEDRAPNLYSFLDYSASHWMSHFKNMDIPDEDKPLEDMVLHLFDRQSSVFQVWSCRAIYPYAYGYDLLDGPSYEPFHLAVFTGYVRVVRRLLDECQVDVDVWDNGKRPLHIATLENQVSIVRMLLERGAKLFTHDEKRYTPMCYATDRGREEILQIFIQATRHSKDRIELLTYALRRAARYGTKETIQLLFVHGADPNPPDSPDSRHVISEACGYRSADIARVFIDNGVKLSHSGIRNAIQGGRVDTLAMFNDAGVGLDGEENGAIALRYGQENTFWWLLNKGVKFDLNSALLEAVKAGYVKATKELLRIGADPNADEVLFHACLSQNYIMVQTLLAKGARKGISRAFCAAVDASPWCSNIVLLLDKNMADPIETFLEEWAKYVHLDETEVIHLEHVPWESRRMATEREIAKRGRKAFEAREVEKLERIMSQLGKLLQKEKQCHEILRGWKIQRKDDPLDKRVVVVGNLLDMEVPEDIFLSTSSPATYAGTVCTVKEQDAINTGPSALSDLDVCKLGSVRAR
ncbi:hypothetical protein FQN50_009330 [Emmonsiellopsis sp. PD_5]|nr:hypothetical protein FQN50_009330 [Emmonsiellopsis sp. PD_5]